jgi:hypothetical protein
MLSRSLAAGYFRQLGDSRSKFCGATSRYNQGMERKVFWIVFTVLGLIADFVLPIWWALAATIPIIFVSWWIAYRSDWF